MTAAELVRATLTGPLSAEEAEAAVGAMVEGTATAVQTAAMLSAIATRGATAAEVAGGVRALRQAMVPVHVADAQGLVDTCGTGGGALTTFNISTAAGLLAAGAGVRIAKHGNRSFSSRSGSADVLEALGVRIELGPDEAAQVLESAGIVFLFAPLYHPAMRQVGPVRRELGTPTLFNILGPLANPAFARRQLVGVADPRLMELVAEALRELGHERALVVHGAPGMDEFSPLGPTEVVELAGGTLRRWQFDPAEQLGWQSFVPAELAGADPADNARLIEGVLAGSTEGAARAAVVLNAGAAIYLAGLADTLAEGVTAAERALRSGAGSACLQRLRAATAAL
ncbi:anthranilate phosphoribosyltransferase [soil metagenome]